MVNRYVVVVVCCSLFGCPSPGTQDAGISVPTALAFCEHYTDPERACDTLTACGQFSTREGCLEVVRANGEQDCSQVEFVKSVRDGWVKYDAALAAKCLGDLPTTCRPDAPSCRKVFSGTKAEGEDCRADSCVTGFYCASDGGCPGTCSEKKPAGSVVKSSTMCIESTKDFFGLPDGGFGIVCKTPVGEGESCASDPCADELHCSPQKKCVKTLALGDACANAGTYAPDCGQRYGIACQPSADGGAPRCGLLAKRGEPCGYCQNDLRCVIPPGQQFGTCGDLGTAGQSCRSAQECSAGLYCNSQSKLCESPRALGAACEGYAECQLGLRCEFELPNDGGFTPEYYCRTYDAGVYEPNYCPETEP